MLKCPLCVEYQEIELKVSSVRPTFCITCLCLMSLLEVWCLFSQEWSLWK